VIESRRRRWMGHVACMGERNGAYWVLEEKPEGKRPLGKLRHKWGIILRWISRKWCGRAWTGLNWLRIGTAGGH
jgi:hypothetical protein